MFDGLKKKLGRFSEDVEEDVDDEAIEEAEAAEADADSDTPTETDEEPSETPADPGDGAAESVADDDTDSSAAEAETSDTDSGAADAEPEVADAETVDTESVDDGTEAAADTDDEDSGGILSKLTPGSSGSEADESDAAQADESDAAQAGESESVDAEPTEEVDTDAEVESADEADTEAEPADAEGEEGRGLAERAKLFATGKTVIDEDDLQKHLDDLELALLGSDVEMSVAQEILDGVKANLTGETRRRLESTGNLVQDALREALYDVISVGQFDFEQRIAEADKPVVIIFTGVNGVGKTTSIAKMSRYLETRGYSSVVANGDTYRAGANEQLEQHARNLDVKCISHDQGSDPAAVLYDGVEYAQANDIDVVLGDTAGRLHTSNDLMAQLEKIDRVIDPDMTVFVDEAVAGQDAVNRAREFNDAAEIDGAILTKADADSQGGAAISVAYVTGKPILFLGTGQDYDDLQRFDPEEIVDKLFGE